MNIILHDFYQHLTFAPLTLTRPTGNLRTGMWTNDERWQFYCPEAQISYCTEAYLEDKFPIVQTNDNYWINAGVIPNREISNVVKLLKKGETLYINDEFIAFRGSEFLPDKNVIKQNHQLIILKNRWDLYLKNQEILKTDFLAYTVNKKSAELSAANTLIGDEKQLFIEDGAVIEGAIINVKEGPVYIGKGAEIMEGTVIRGSLAMSEHSVLKLSAKVYGATSLGQHCKVGGEVSNVIFQGYSNKGHDGFLGNSLVGEWCNLGADTNCSNLKNNYGNVKTYNYETKKMEQTDVVFMGVSMGDYSKTAINTMLNTATVIGVCANLFTAGFPPKFVPDFSWGGGENSSVYDLQKAIEAADKMMERRGLKISPDEKKILQYLFEKKR